MTIQRRRYANLDTLVLGGKPANQSGQIALQMDAKGKKIGHYQNSVGPRADQAADGGVQIGLRFQKSGFNQAKSASRRGRCRHDSHCVVSRFDAGTMRKDDNSVSHSYYEHSNIC